MTPLVGADGPAVLVSGRVAYVLWHLSLRRLPHDVRRDGVQLDDEVLATLYAFDRCATAHRERGASGMSDSGPIGQAHGGPGGTLTAMGTKSAAERLGCSQRHVRRLADAGEFGTVAKTGRSWALDPLAVEDYRRRQAAS